MNTFIIIIAVLAGGWILLVLGLKVLAALLRKSCLKAARGALAGDDILKMSGNASFLGADFPGPNLPPRTSGVLAVTASRVLFLPWFPRRAITLPRETIAGAALEDHFRGMAYNIPALVLKIKGVGDHDGTMGWLVHEGEEWKRKITTILKG